MNGELNFYLRTVPNLLRYAQSALEEHLSGSGNLEDVPTEAIYEDFIKAWKITEKGVKAIEG